MEKTGRTLKELAQEAYDVQDACNLSGVAHGFARAMSDLRKLPEGQGTDLLRKHPIAIAWADKIASLCGMSTHGSKAMDALTECVRIIRS